VRLQPQLISPTRQEDICGNLAGLRQFLIIENDAGSFFELGGALQYLSRMSDELSVDQKFERLKDALRRDHEKDVQDAVWSFSTALNDWVITDEVVERLLAILTDEEMYRSPFAGYLLNFFELESRRLTDRQKWLCIRFLNAHGDRFTDGFSSIIAGELRAGLYLRMKRPNPEQWDDYQKMQRN
jgi:hypothetical protein